MDDARIAGTTDPFGITSGARDVFSPATVASPYGRGRRAFGVAAAGGACAVAFALATSIIRPPAELACDPTVLAIETSASGQSSELRSLVVDVLAATAERSVLCETPLHAIAVRGATPQLILSDADLHDLTHGATFKTRETNLDVERLEAIVDDAADALYADDAVGSSSSIPALYAAAQEFDGDEVDLLIATDGVQDADGVSLNRPLTKGEGTRLGKSIPVTELEVGRTTLFGLTLVAAAAPAPGDRWTSEVIEANAVMCARATGEHCRTFSVASAEDVVR